MGIIDDLKKWAHPYEDEDEEYEDDFPDLRDRGDTGAFADRRSAERKAEDRRNKVVNINPYHVDIMGDLIDELENNGLYL